MGFLTGLNFKLIGAIALAVVFIGMGIAIKVQTARLHASEREFEAFAAKVEAIGRAQIAINKLKYQTDLALKGKLDYENKTLRGNLADAARRVRDALSRGGGVPQIPAGPGSAPVAQIDRAGLNDALRVHVETVRGILADTGGLVEEGAAAVIDLNTGKAWITEQSAVK